MNKKSPKVRKLSREKYKKTVVCDYFPIEHQEKVKSMNFKSTNIVLLISSFWFLFSTLLPLPAAGAESDSLFTQGKVLFEMGEYEQAKEKFAQHLTQYPDDPLALFYLGKTEPDGIKSQEYFRSLLNRFPNYELADAALFQIAQFWYAKGYYITAQQQFLRLLEQYPHSPLAAQCQYFIGKILLTLDKPDQAEEEFQKLVQLYPASEVAIYANCGLVNAYQLQEKYQQAISLGESLLNKANSFRSHLLYTLADCYHRVGEKQKAEELLARIPRECPQSYEATLVNSPVVTQKSTPDDSTAQKATSPVEIAADSSAQYYIQAGAFSNIANATALHSRLAAGNFPVKLATKLSKQKLLYLVQVGPYKSRASAEEVAEKIR
ncbi:MAG: tetratricopeptide repeat protein, partial [Candidatus Latescibacteria bacterium]|nr:tetratricopeptide repeat protein [Candidatus Latescibacterota bacterium]